MLTDTEYSNVIPTEYRNELLEFNERKNTQMPRVICDLQIISVLNDLAMLCEEYEAIDSVIVLDTADFIVKALMNSSD